MDDQQRSEVLRARKEALLGEVVRFDEYLEELDAFLEANPTFNLDVVTDIQPEILEGTKSSKQYLEFWKGLYEGMSQGKSHVAIIHAALGYEHPHFPHKKLDGPVVTSAQISVVEDLKPEDLVFERVEVEGKNTARVQIRKRATVVNDRGGLNYVTVPITLAEQEGIDGIWSQKDPTIVRYQFGDSPIDAVDPLSGKALHMDGSIEAQIQARLNDAFLAFFRKREEFNKEKTN